MEMVIEIIGEVIFELLFEGVFEASRNSKLPLPVRILLIGLISLFVTGMIGVVFYAGWLLMKKYMIAGILIMGIGVIMLTAAVRKFRQTYFMELKEDVK